jgi:phosphatidate cytidylyltransferase
MKRLAVFSVVGPATISCVRAGSPWLDLLAASGAGIAVGEASALVRAAGSEVNTYEAVGAAFLMLEGGADGAIAAALLDLLASQSGGNNRPISSFLTPVLIGGAVGLPLHLGLQLRKSERGLEWLTWGMITTWLADAAAYLLGPRMGGPALPATINSNKTWLGYLPGAALSLVSGVSFARRLGVPRTTAAVVGVIVGAGSSVGDMLESALKRRAGKVDSGTLLPGYGGLLDRLDGLLASTATLYIAYRIVQQRQTAVSRP